MDPVAPPPPSEGRWYHDVWFVLLMLFVVLGPLGLPLLWKSPRFSRTAKMALTIAVIALTAWLLVASIDYVTMVINELQAIPRF